MPAISTTNPIHCQKLSFIAVIPYRLRAVGLLTRFEHRTLPFGPALRGLAHAAALSCPAGGAQDWRCVPASGRVDRSTSIAAIIVSSGTFRFTP